ncbi:MAG: alanine/glycine:cation symporter family protein [Nesterenkonia sp.]|uniref:alanine/glycine:cation symporter family protein n=1 Tax=Nesterenkonia marinintestina TaxID=2979865 RepID=UPI0021C10A84|nr:alanine/glycine:cation symporter family protein [Nesterenkonia sp. GX14115]MDO5492795.1 alanine/glycine:cation symporter family protein [Nesterenkonia sp.]
MSTQESLILAVGEEEVETGAQGIADTIDGWFAGITEWFAGIIFGTIPIGGHDAPVVVLWSILAAIGFTIYFGFVQFRSPKVALEVVRGKWSKPTDPGEVSHFQALTSALSATVGLGNIAGVAVAVTLGGPGAAFWMMIAGFFGMCTKFVECTLGVKYRTIDEDGTVHGGPFKYLPVAFKKLGRIPVAIITGLFAIAIILFGVAGGGMFQANQAFSQVRAVTGGEDGIFGSDMAAFLFGIGFALLVALVIIGGIKSIGSVTSKLVPAMALVYVAAGLLIIAINFQNVPAAFGAIIEGAFNPEGIAGGVLGVILIGVQRAAFSNEAGIGSAPIAHSAVRTKRPVSEGFNALLEPFIDTVVICMMTALIIIIANPASYQEALDGEDMGDVAITSDAFATVLPWFPGVLAMAVFLFAFSTLITWAYYGMQAWRHLFGKSKVGDMIFRLLICFFVVVGCMMTFSNIIDFADSALFMCIFINVIGLVILAPKVKEEMKQYLADRRAGRLMDDPEPLDSDRRVGSDR